MNFFFILILGMNVQEQNSSRNCQKESTAVKVSVQEDKN